MSSAVPDPRKLYFVSPAVDFVLMGGLSLACFPLLLRLQDGGLPSTAVSSLVIGFWWIANWPHFSATNYRLYHSRGNIAQYPVTALAVPLLVLAATVAAFASPAVVAPFFIKLVVIWSVYHFAGQTLGLTMIYARRAGLAVGNVERWGLLTFLLGTFLARVAWNEVGTGSAEYFGVAHPRLGVPEWLGSVLVSCALAGGVVFVIGLFRGASRAGRSVPAIVLLPAICHFVWFVPGRGIEYFYAFVPLFHSFQYLLIAWSMQLKERMDLGGHQPSKSFALRETARWFALNVLGGAFLFFALPTLAELTGASSTFSFAVVATAVQLHHFFVDGVIWKLKNPKVSSPLSVHVPELITPRPRPSAQPLTEAA